MSSDLTWNKHVENIVAKAGNIGQCDLLTIYVMVIRPVLEYACTAWHSLLT